MSQPRCGHSSGKGYAAPRRPASWFARPATIEILLPDALGAALGVDADPLQHQAVEAWVAQAYRTGKPTYAQSGIILGLDHCQTDALLKRANAFRPEEVEELASDGAAGPAHREVNEQLSLDAVVTARRIGHTSAQHV